ncbi:MAG: tetratricopeptide repeat protein [Planctomycetota bacterium]
MTRQSQVLVALVLAAAVGLAIWTTVEEDPSSDSRGPGDFSPPPAEPDPVDPPLEPKLPDAASGGSRTNRPPLRPEAPEPPPKLEEARALFTMKQYPDALLALDRILEKDPKNADALYWRGRTQINLASPRAAEADLRAAVKHGGETAERLLWRAWALHRLRKDGEAEKLARRALTLDPKAARAHSVLASIHLFHGRKKEAREEVRLALETDPEESMALALSKRLENR